MKPETFVKNEAGKDEGAGVHEKGDGDEHKIGEHNNDEDFEVLSLRCSPKDEHGHMKQSKRNDVLAGNDAPNLRIERLAEHTKHGERCEAEHGQAESGKKWELVAQCHGAQNHKEDEDSERDA